MKQLQDVRQSDAGVDNLLAALPEVQDSASAKANMEVVAAAFASGWTTSASISSGRWDSHSNNDSRQYEAIDDLLEMVDHLWGQLERLNIAHKTTVVMLSEFARTPGYNNAEGKDHWPTNSMVLMGNGIQGNRTIGATDNDQKPLKVHPQTLELDENGVELNSGIIMKGLRRIAGMEGGLLDTEFPIDAPDVDLFV